MKKSFFHSFLKRKSEKLTDKNILSAITAMEDKLNFCPWQLFVWSNNMQKDTLNVTGQKSVSMTSSKVLYNDAGPMMASGLKSLRW